MASPVSMIRSIASSAKNIAGPSRITRQVRYASSSQASTSTTTPYPYSTGVVAAPSTLSPGSSSTTPTDAPRPPQNLLSPRNGWSLIEHQNSHLRTVYDPQSLGSTLFGRRSKDRLRTGSILTVVNYTDMTKTATTSFSGILIATRHRGIDTTFRVRNVVNRIGVEMAYKVCSPFLKEVKVIRRAKGRKGSSRDLGHRKAYWIRDSPEVLSRLAQSVRVK